MSGQVDLPSTWLPATKSFFDRVYRSLKTSQSVLLHPATTKLPAEEWDTLSWNAAWIAAEFFQDRSLKPKHYLDTPVDEKVEEKGA